MLQRFNNSKHPYEMILEENTVVNRCPDQSAIPLRLNQASVQTSKKTWVIHCKDEALSPVLPLM